MFFLESDRTDPYYNLALEEHLFLGPYRDKEFFLLWQNDHTIVVGRFQNTAEEINQDFVDARGIHVVRRLSGGGAVYHAQGNLNFTFLVGQELTPEYNFHIFVEPVLRALQKLGVTAEFTGRNDLVIDGKKFSGNSQCARSGRLLHHGCILLDADPDTMQQALRVKEAKFESKSIKSVQSRVTTINAHAPQPISMPEFKEALKHEIMSQSEIVPFSLTEEDRIAVETLADTKYRTWEWNYGSSPAYQIRREEKFPAGLVTIQMDVEHSVIRKIRIRGDFFGNGEISELEEALIGLPLDDHLPEALSALQIDHYMHGISAVDLAGLLR